jgi:hypothetical protein
MSGAVPLHNAAKFCVGGLFGGNQFLLVIAFGRASIGLFAIFFDPLPAQSSRLHRRQPGPFRTARADGYPDRISMDNPFLD